MRIAVGADHGGAQLKKELVEHLRRTQAAEIVEIGARDADDSCDYPDVAKAVCQIVTGGECSLGVLVCGTGIGISIAANKTPGIRCALVHEAFTARMAKEHNDANVLAFGGRVTGPEIAKDALNAFISAQFQGGRHKTRVDKIENQQSAC